MSALDNRYPRAVDAGGVRYEFRAMTAEDEAALLAFTRTLPTHDLLFLPRDIREAKVLSAWVRELQVGNIASLIALRDGVVVGCSAIARDPLSFSPHVGDLRVILAPTERDRGLGRALIQESFLVALAAGLDRLTAHATGDQTAAIGVFEDMGFRPEAWLRDHVRDETGKTWDIVILGLDVHAQQSKLSLYGVADAFEG